MIEIVTGDSRVELEKLPAGSIHCCVTSPPYFGLRDYGHDEQIGLEETPEHYIAELVAVFRQVHRALRDDGTLWVVIGDSYASKPRGNRYDDLSANSSGLTNPERQARVPRPNGKTSQRHGRSSVAQQLANERRFPGLKNKDLIGIPWMFAFAMRADGWYLRRDIIWAKNNPMPESCRDRPTSSHEYMFLFTKRDRYYYDWYAIREPVSTLENRATGVVRDRDNGYDSKEKVLQKKRPSKKRGEFGGKSAAMPGREAFRAVTDSRNKRSVWRVNAQPYAGDHYAVYPPALIEPCILAGTSEQVCGNCGAPYARMLGEAVRGNGRGSGNLERKHRQDFGGLFGDSRHQAHSIPWEPTERPTIGWTPTCTCQEFVEGERLPRRARVLDPFSGAGTTMLVADRLQRDGVAIEVNPKFAEDSRRRLRRETPLFTEVSMSDEFSRPPHTKSAKTKTGSSAPIIDKAEESLVKSGQGVNDQPSGPSPETPAPDPAKQ